MRKCDSCGKPYQESKDVFCPHCGAVAQKQCTHGSSFDSKKYDRGEIYHTNKTQYGNTTYTQGYEPHAQRKKSPYAQPAKTYKGDYKKPKLNIPDIIKTLTSGNNKDQKPKAGAIIAFCIIIAFNIITGAINSDNYDYDNSTEYVEENTEFWVMSNDAAIEFVDEKEGVKTFTLTINSIALEDEEESLMDEAESGELSEKILSEESVVSAEICTFTKSVVEEQEYQDALFLSKYCFGEQVDGKCKYKFSCEFDYDEIVCLGDMVDFFLEDERFIHVALPFSAFSVSKDGEITYYNCETDETTHKAVFSECRNNWEVDGPLYINFNKGDKADGGQETE